MTRRMLVLQALRAAGSRGCTTAELCRPDCGGVRFSARIMELREAGAIIKATPIRRGSHRYELVRDVLPVAASLAHPADREDADSAPSGQKQAAGRLFEPSELGPVSAITGKRAA